MSREERYPPVVMIPPALPPDPRREPVERFPVEIFDVRPGFDAMVPYLRKTKKIRTDWRGRPVMRRPEAITHLMVHQLAVTYHREGRAFAERAAKAAYHVAVSDDGGEVAMLKPLGVYAHHGNAANAFSVGLGIEGGYPGLASQRHRKHTPVTPGLVAGIRVAMTRIVTELPTVHTLIAHRQTSGDRRGDPGQELWIVSAEIAEGLGLAVDETTTWPSKRSGPGRPIPGAWGGAGAY